MTSLALFLFVAIWVWAWGSRRRSQFDAMARLPLEEDPGLNASTADATKDAP
ncbi:MAG TPA: cbb3-type cytochrome c oxidase subunit 3 [Steroidobacteraceae bacterium]|nr:cbb3-type cytochrome c oxidase subunit 3 [Steroidobacteraceae bacterium]